MNKLRFIVTYLLAAGLTLLLPAPAWAGDEDVYVPMYLTYDPVTGTLTDQGAKPPGPHNPGQSPAEVQDLQAGTTATGEQPAVMAAPSGDTVINSDQQDDGPGRPGIILIAGLIGTVVLLLVTGLFLRKRKVA